MNADELPPQYPETPERTCRYGHGALSREEGYFTATGVDLIVSTKATRDERMYTPINNGLRYTFEIWRCQRCGYLETIDGGEAL